MNKLYRELFYVPKYGKVREKVMTARTAVTVTVMVLCLMSMALTAYAYFTCSVASGTNMIKAAYYTNVISITDAASNTVAVVSVDDKTFTADLEAGKTYSVTVAKSDNSTATTGFCIVTASGSTETYHTQQIGKDANAPGGKTDSITFKLTVPSDSKAQFQARWGTSTYYEDYIENGDNEKLYITNDETIAISMLPSSQSEGADNTEPAETTQETEAAAQPETTAATEETKTTE